MRMPKIKWMNDIKDSVVGKHQRIQLEYMNTEQQRTLIRAHWQTVKTCLLKPVWTFTVKREQLPRNMTAKMKTSEIADR